MTEQCVTMQVAYVCTGLLYIICVCLCVCVCVYQCDSLPTQQKRGVTEGLPSRWQTVWSSKNRSFFLDWVPVSLPFFSHLSALPPSIFLSLSLFSPCISSQWNEKGWALVSMSNGGVIVSVSCLSLQCVGPDPSCRAVTAVRWWDAKNFVGFVEGEIKHGTRLIWHPYLHGIGPLKHRQVSQPD